jgi:prevent-host-death family protein
LSVLRHPRQRKTNGRSPFLITIPRRRRVLHGGDRRLIFRLDQEVDAMDVAITHTDPALADLVRRAEAGEEVVLTRDGKPVARVVPVSPARPMPSPEERLAIIREVQAAVRAKNLPPGPPAERAADFLYDEDGLPA